MDNDLMARRLRPPSEPSKQSATSSLATNPVPSALPWETEPPAAASREDIPWDTPAADAWPPDPAADEPSGAIWAREQVAAPAESGESEPEASAAAQPTLEPEVADPTPAPTHDSTVWPPVPDVPVADEASEAATLEMAAPTAETDTASATSPSATPEAPWDRPSDDDFDQPMDARVDGPSWDEPSPFAYFDDSPVFDDRPPDMLEAFHSPVAVAVEERPPEEATVEAVASTFVEPPPETDAAFVDPYDEAAPVVAEVAERAQVPQWPSWNGHDAAETVHDEATADLSAVAQVETDPPVQSAFVPWDETAPEEPPQFELESAQAPAVPETAAGSVGPAPSDDLFASPPVSEDELPEPDEVAPWDFVADDDPAALFENSVAEVANVDFEPIAEVETVADADPAVDADPSVETEPEPEVEAEADSFEAWLAMAIAGGIADVQAEPEMAVEAEEEAEPAETEAEAEADAGAEEAESMTATEAEAEAEPSAEPEMAAATETEAEAEAEVEFEAEAEADAEDEFEAEAEAEAESVQIEVPAPSAFPATIYASGPESGLPANVVLRIELSIVDDAKRLNVTNVASASEFAPRVEEALFTQSPEPAPADPSPEPASAEQVDDSAWPAIWDPDRPTAGFAAPAAVAASPADAWAWTDPTPVESPYELSTPTDTWPEVDRPQDAFAPSPDMAAPMALAPLAPLEMTDDSATASANQSASPRISTIAEPQSDLWFLSAEPETTPDEAPAETSADKPGMSLLTVGLTIGMAILVIVLVLVFIQLMTSLLG